MRRAILVVLDGLGIGALDDVAVTRPADIGSDSLAHALAAAPAELAFLTGLGLGHVAPSAGLASGAPPSASWGRAELGYPGADSFLGHQVMMGGNVSAVHLQPFAELCDAHRDALIRAGHDARRLDGWPVLVVDDAMLVADSLEADAGMNYNVTGSLDAVSFEAIRAVAEVVRGVARVPRVITVGARDMPAEDIFAAVEERDGATGIDTPKLGIYDRGAEIEHLGIEDVGAERQLPTLSSAAGLPVSLIGKMADIVVCDAALRLPAVATTEVLRLMHAAVDDQRTGLIAVNVQELDLAGHRQDAEAYVAILEEADASLGRLASRLGSDDLLLICADHGNDPTGTATHSREAVPILAVRPGSPPRPLGTRRSLADIGATLAEWLGVGETGTGASFAELV
jgi:phosphopentomutase